jgi:hypothetical protein
MAEEDVKDQDLLKAFREASTRALRHGLATQDINLVLAGGNGLALAMCAGHLESIRKGIDKLNGRVDEGVQLAMTFAPSLLSGGGKVAEQFGGVVRNLVGRKKGTNDDQG